MISITELVVKFDKLPPLIKIFIRSLVMVIPIYVSGLLSYYASKATGITPFMLYSGIIVLLLMIASMIMAIFIQIRERIYQEYRRNENMLQSAYRIALKEVTNRLHITDPEKAYSESLESIRKIVKDIYQILTATFGEDKYFGVNFMTISYVDGYVTIPAYGNSDDKEPHSLPKRRRYLDIYQKTETAKMYDKNQANEQVDIKIIEDTMKPEVDYAFIHPKQSKYIRSTIIYPVLSKDRKLLGTLVLQVDSPGFFKIKDEKFWKKFLGIFADAIVFNKIIMDELVERNLVNLNTIDPVTLDLNKEH